MFSLCMKSRKTLRLTHWKFTQHGGCPKWQIDFIANLTYKNKKNKIWNAFMYFFLLIDKYELFLSYFSVHCLECILLLAFSCICFIWNMFSYLFFYIRFPYFIDPYFCMYSLATSICCADGAREVHVKPFVFIGWISNWKSKRQKKR